MDQGFNTPLIEQFRASAGSGKTFTLTTRFLELMRRKAGRAPASACGASLAGSPAWPEIMAVTFTNKAAAQMKEKVVAALKARALGLDPPQAKGWSEREAADKLEMVLRHFHRLNIRTIDSLLHLIVRAFALPLGVTPDFDVVFDLDEILGPLLDETVARAERPDSRERELIEGAVSALLYLEDGKGFMPARNLGKRLKVVVRHLLTDTGRLDNDEAEIGSRIHSSAEYLRNAALDMNATLEAERLRGNSNFLGFLDKAANFTSGGEPPTGTYAQKACLDDCLLKASRGGCSQEAEKHYRRLCKAYADYANVYANLSGARNLAAFVALGRHMVDRIYEHQRRFGVMLNQTWPHLAVTALSGQSGVTDAFCRLGASLSAILMDEFQDTSREQWEALKPLAEECLSTGGRLFIVGDVKQSIYGWRGGEAGLFAEAAADPELTAIADVKQSSLEYNWRSLERIIDFNNEIFARLGVPDTAMRVAREMAGGDSAGARRLSESVADAFADAGQANPPNTPNPGGYVRLQKIRGDNKEDILELVREALRDAVVYDLLERRAPGDVAVLVRTNSEASLVSKWLIDWGAPVVTENSLRLGEHPLIRELLSALAFLDYPLDDASFFEFVSGGRILHPIGGPGREQLFAWLASDPGARPLYPRFRESFPDAWEKLLAPFVRRSGLMGPYDTVREMVRAYGLLERFPGDEAFLRRFLEVVFAAEQSGRLSLSSFLEYWRESGPEEKVPLPEHLDAVRVLTMHKAKGLEFPVVVAPFHHWTLDVSDNAVVHEFEGRRLLAPLKKGLGDTYHRALAPLLQEQLHLLYVAWTRPREELYCMLTSAPFYDTRSPISKALDVLLEDTRFHEDEYGRVVHEVGEPPETPAPPPRPEAPSGPAAASEPESVPEPMSWLPRLKIHRNLSMDMGRDELLSAGPLFDERARGTVFHEALNLATGRGSGVDPELLAARSLAAAPVPHPPEAAKELAQALEWVLGQDELSTYLSAGEPETSIMDESGKLHRPDLIAHGDFGTAVVEYKTGDAQPEHENQVRRYMDMVRAMRRFPKPVYGVIAYLDLRRVVRVEGG